MTKELLKVFTFHLAKDVQPHEQVQVILERGHLLLPIAHTSRSTEHLRLVSVNGVINRLGSFHQAFFTLDVWS